MASRQLYPLAIHNDVQSNVSASMYKPNNIKAIVHVKAVILLALKLLTTGACFLKTVQQMVSR